MVRSLDSIEAPVRWRRSNLTDGIWPKAADPAAVAELAEANRRRSELMNRVLTPERKQKRTSLENRKKKTQERLKALPAGRTVYAAATHFSPQGNFKPTKGVPRAIHVLHRGDILSPTKRVSPGTIPLSESADWRLQLRPEHMEGDRRAALAHWITSDTNPLTWRSIANRIWQYHFGKGLVDSPNDLGRMGQLPTHPELLDWLAFEFRRTQSFKHLHRLILSSSVYQQSSAFLSDNAQIDGDNRFLWRMNRRRLSAEELRDSILAVSGLLLKAQSG